MRAAGIPMADSEDLQGVVGGWDDGNSAWSAGAESVVQHGSALLAKSAGAVSGAGTAASGVQLRRM